MTHQGNPVEIGTQSALPQRCCCRLILALFVFNHNIAFETLLVPTYLYSLPLWPLQSLKL
jgi:hypothetical protein